jgi:hypothetical protein
VMTDRSSRGSDKPVISRCALTQHKCWGPDPRTSSRPAVMRPHHKAEHMAAHDQIVKTPKTPCHAGAVHTRLSELRAPGVRFLRLRYMLFDHH